MKVTIAKLTTPLHWSVGTKTKRPGLLKTRGEPISETRDSFTSNTRLIASDLRLNGLMLRMRDFQCPLYQSELS